MIISAKYRVKPWTSCGFFYSVKNFSQRNLTQPHDGWITNPPTRWFHHTVGFSFFYHYTFQGFCLRTLIQPLEKTTGLLNSWVFPFVTTNLTNLNGSTRGGILPEHPHGRKSLILTLPGLRVSIQRHTYGSESVL